MKKIVLTLFLVSLLGSTYSQVYDLIVTTEGDSIACDIEDITDTAVHFKMIYENHWMHAHLPSDQVLYMEENAVDRRMIEFEPGTSYFRTVRSKSEVRSIFFTRRNSIYAGADFALTFSINYERLIPIAKSFGLSLRGGIGYNPFVDIKDGKAAILQGTLLIGGPSHFFEMGFGYQRYIEDKIDIGAFVLAFRYMALSGFYIKPCINLNIVMNTNKWNGDSVVFPGLAIGFSL